MVASVLKILRIGPACLCACTFGTTGISAGPSEMNSTSPTSSVSTEGAPTASTDATPTTSTATAQTMTASGTTGEPIGSGVAFRVSKLEFVDPHLFLSDGENTDSTGDPAVCNDGTPGMNTFLNQDIGDGDYNLVIYFAELSPGAEMRLLEGDCADPGDGTMWTCTNKDGSPMTIFDTSQIDSPPCRDLDTVMLQPVNVAMLNEPPPPCWRTEKLDFAIAISNAVGALNLRNALIVLSPDDIDEPTRIPSGLLYGFLPMASAEDITLEVPLLGTLNMWDIIDAPECATQFPDQVPSVDMLDFGGGSIPGVWVALNLEAERVIYMP